MWNRHADLLGGFQVDYQQTSSAAPLALSANVDETLTRQ
jgi:hypothetical protein